tara:strand:+ start:382 stop:2028 length:1647 start_codon:yes stop_codon:yes gene_type:complete
MSLDRAYKLSFFLLLFSIFFWDLRLVPEDLNVEKNITSKILGNIDIRFVYLITLFPLFFFFKFFIREKLITYKFIFISILVFAILILHQIYTSSEGIRLIEIAYSLIVLLTILILKVFGKNFLDNKILIIKFVTFISVFFYIFSLVVFDFLEIKNEDGELLTWNRFSFEPCRIGFFNDYNFVFSESSHFGMVAISIFLINFYYVIKTNFKDKSLLVCFIAYSLILFNNMSLTVIVGIVSCQFIIIITNLNRENIKYLISSFVMILFFLLILLSFQTCKWKFNNALWLIKQKIPILKLNLEIMSKKEKEEMIKVLDKGKDYKLKVNTKGEERFEKNFKLTKKTDLSSAVLAHNLRIVKESLNFINPSGISKLDETIDGSSEKNVKEFLLKANQGEIAPGKYYINFPYDKVIVIEENRTIEELPGKNQSKLLGWGLNRYETAFEHYTKFRINKINHTYAIYVNNEDGSMNLTKLLVEFGLLNIILILFFTFFIFSSKISIDDKIFLFPIVFVQTFLRGAGYFNGGFLIATILIILIVTKSYDGKKSNKIL